MRTSLVFCLRVRWRSSVNFGERVGLLIHDAAAARADGAQRRAGRTVLAAWLGLALAAVTLLRGARLQLGLGHVVGQPAKLVGQVEVLGQIKLDVRWPAALVAVLVVLLTPLPALAQTSPPPDGSGGTGANTCVLGVICENPATWLQETITGVLTNLVSGLADDFGGAVVGFLNQVNFLTRTPENLTYNNDLVKQYVSATQALADGLLAVVVLVSGYNVMLRPHMGATYVGARELLPRLLLGAILINTAAWWCQFAIDVNNAACGVFGAPSIADTVAAMLRVILDPTHLSGLLMLLVATVMTILPLVQQLMRLALVDVLLILAPLAAVVWILPQSQAWGRLWGRLFVATVFAQAVQVLTLRLARNGPASSDRRRVAPTLAWHRGPGPGAEDPRTHGRRRSGRKYRCQPRWDRGWRCGRVRGGHSR
jgi:hypothetical protein